MQILNKFLPILTTKVLKAKFPHLSSVPKLSKTPFYLIPISQFSTERQYTNPRFGREISEAHRFVEQQRPEKASEILLQLYTKYQSTEEERQFIISNLAEVYIQLKMPKSALSFLSKLSKETFEQSNLDMVKFNRLASEACIMLNQFDQAVGYMDNSEHILKELVGEDDEGFESEETIIREVEANQGVLTDVMKEIIEEKVLLNLNRIQVFMKRGELLEIYKMLEDSERLAKLLQYEDKIRLQTKIYLQFGIFHKQKHEYEKALQRMEYILETLKNPTADFKLNNAEVVQIYKEISEILVIQGRKQKAQEYLNDAYSIANSKSSDISILQGEVNVYLGNFYFKNDELKKSIQSYQNALMVFDYFPESSYSHQSQAYKSLSHIFITQSKFSEAEKYLLKEVDFRLKYEHRRNEIDLFQCYSKLAFIYQEKNVDQAIIYQEKAMEAAKKGKKMISIDFAYAHYDLGNIYMQSEKLEKAAEEFQACIQALKGLKVSDNFLLRNVLTRKGQVLMEQEKYEKALDTLLKAIDIEEENNVSSFDNLYFEAAQCYVKLRDTDEAFLLFDQAIEKEMNMTYSNPVRLARIYSGIASTYKLKDKPEEALEYISNAVDTLESEFLPKDMEFELISLYHSQGELFEELGAYKEAQQCFSKSIDLSEVHHYRSEKEM